jgi:hypothetical protein
MILLLLTELILIISSCQNSLKSCVSHLSEVFSQIKIATHLRAIFDANVS